MMQLCYNPFTCIKILKKEEEVEIPVVFRSIQLWPYEGIVLHATPSNFGKERQKVGLLLKLKIHKDQYAIAK